MLMREKPEAYKKNCRFTEFFSKHKVDFVIIGFIILCLSPVFQAWYYGDDTSTRDIHVFMRQENRNLLQYILHQMEYFIIKLGRLFPVHLIQRFVTFYLISTIEMYRIFIIAMNIIAIFCFASMAKAYTGSKRLYYAILVLYPGIFLFFTRYDDAITSYFMFVQTLVIYLSVSLILLKSFLEKNKPIFLVLSIFLYVLSLLTYESSYLMVLAYPLAIFYFYSGTFGERLKITIRRSAPYFAVAFSCFAVYVYFSLQAVSNYKGISYNLNPKDVVPTFVYQVGAALPVVPHSYLLENPDLNHILKSIGILDIVTAILFISLLIYVFTLPADKRLNRPGKGFLIWLSVLLIAFPSFLISISVKYQQSLTWGNGYLTTYITRFGLLTIGCFIYEWIQSRIKTGFVRKTINVILVLCLALINIFCHQGNRNVLVYKNQTTYLRMIAEASFKAGLLENIPHNSVIILGNIWYGYPSFTRDKIFSDVCGKKVTTVTIPEYLQGFNDSMDNMDLVEHTPDRYYFHFEKFLSNDGFAFIGKLDTLTIDESTIHNIYAKDFKLFYSGDECSSVSISVLDNNKFVRKKVPLAQHGFKTYMAAFTGVVDLQTIELVNNVNPSIWR